MQVTWVYGWNLPGYLPDASDAAESWSGARDALIWELERIDCGEPDEPEGWTCTDAERDHAIAVLAGATPDQPLDVRCGRYVYFIVDSETDRAEAYCEAWREANGERPA